MRGAPPLQAIKRGVANMDVLVSLGTNASYGYSMISILHHHFEHHHHYGTYIPTVRARPPGGAAGVKAWQG